MDDDQNEPISNETEEKHEVKEDGEMGAQEVFTSPATRRYRCGVVVVIVIDESHVFHLHLKKWTKIEKEPRWIKSKMLQSTLLKDKLVKEA